MSIIKKGIKALKKIGKSIVNFVKDHWQIIVIAGLCVFTMGLATVGFAGFAGAMSAASAAGASGFGAFMSAVGSTMWAGVTALGGTLGIGPGAQGAAAVAGGVEGVGLGGGHLAAALGSESAKAGIAAQQAAAITGPGVTTAGATPLPASATTSFGGGTGVTEKAASLTNQELLKQGTTEVVKKGMGDLTKAALVTTTGTTVAGWAQGKMSNDPKMKGFWTLDLSRKGRRQLKKDWEDGLIQQPWDGFVQAPQVTVPQAPAPLSGAAAPPGPPVAPGLMNEDPWGNVG